MARKGSALTVTDLFCGAGGSSIGAEGAGATLRMASNHWQLAVETHAENFPHADHDCANVSQVDPRRYPSTDVLLASPECTNHSQAKTRRHNPDLFNPAGDPAADRSRATMWDVARFAEHHRYSVIVVENVVEVMKWAPIDGWFLAMERLGYRHQIVSLNSMMAHPTPQSRDRWYCVFWREGNRAPDLELRPRAWCPKCDADVEGIQSWKRPDRRVGRYRQQYVYRCGRCAGEVWPYAWPALSALDMALPCPRIGDRERPLADATRRRIAVGLERIGRHLLVQVAGHTYERPGSGYCRAWPTARPMPAQTATLSHALVVPTEYGGTHADSKRAHGTDEPLPTQTARQTMALATLPFLAELRGGGSDARAVTDPLATVTAGGNHHALVTPPVFVVKNYGDGNDPSMAHYVTEPLGAVTTQDHHSLVALPFTVDYHGNGRPQPIDRPLPTQDTRDRHGLVTPAVEVDDCGFRMLEPHEIARAMAFPDTYTVLGNKRERVRMYGNAVTPPAMSLLVERALASLA